MNDIIIVHRMLHFGESAISGIIYSTEELQKMIDNFLQREKPVFGVLEYDKLKPWIIDLEYIISEVVDMYLDEEGVVVHNKILDTTYGNILKERINLINTSIKISPIMTGQITQNHAVDIRLHGVKIDINDLPVDNK